MDETLQEQLTRFRGFSLIEVVLAMGVFLITALTLVGLLGPALKSVSTVEKTDEVASVVDSVNAFLNSSPYIELDDDPDSSRFNAIYNAVQNDGYAVLFVYRWYDDANDRIRQEIGFENDQGGSVNTKSVVNANSGNNGNGGGNGNAGGNGNGNAGGNGNDNAGGNGNDSGTPFDNATSSIYRVVLTASSAMLSTGSVTQGTTGTYPQYTLAQAIGAYDENYLALEIRIFTEDPDAFNPITDIPTNMATLAEEVPIFTYDTAILRY